MADRIDGNGLDLKGRGPRRFEKYGKSEAAAKEVVKAAAGGRRQHGKRPLSEKRLGVVSPEQRRLDFLAALRQCHGNMTRAAELVGWSRKYICDLCDQEPEFEACVRSIREEVVDRLEESAMQRAIHGHKRPVWSQKTGELLGYETVHHDTLTQFLLKGNRRERYADRIEVKLTAEQFAQAARAAIGGDDAAARAVIDAEVVRPALASVES